MISDSYIVPECAVRPGSFGALMALYETNYIKVGLLIGDLDLYGDLQGSPDKNCLVSLSPRDCDLHLWVESRTRYTQILRMTYIFDDEGSAIADPDLVIRIYDDARMAEVVGWAEHHRHALLDDMATRFAGEIDRRWSQNMMLSKWLDYLLDVGHSFDASVAESRQLARSEADLT
jgi:uncharacterized protein YqiB (DUF1249 family)